MGADQSTPDKIKLELKPRNYQAVNLAIPYQQLSMIKLLQANYEYEVKGTLYFDSHNQFKSFEIRTDGSPIESTGASDWRIQFHTHPDRTAQRYGVRYYSPPSVEDVLEVYSHNQRFVPETVDQSLGEISLVVTNEGIYLMQTDRQAFSDSPLAELDESEQEAYLHERYNPFISSFIIERVKAVYELEGWGQPDLANPDRLTYAQFSTMVKGLAHAVSQRFGFTLKFYDWKELSEQGLTLSTSTYYANKRVQD